jgi:2-polyprenyl-3-methyl-5-hydroxy-6-metoxy-1,4-benzoquinol methylase
MELNAVNKMLGGHNITIEGIQKLLHPLVNRPMHICEAGCGGGDNLFAVYKWCQRKGIRASFTGIDIKEYCIDFAKQQYPDLPSSWMISDYEKVTFETRPDVIYTSLFSIILPMSN